MKKLIPFLFLFLQFITSCKDSEPTAPEEAAPTGEILAEKNIGPEGGILETTNFKLSVPEGSFEQSIQLKLIKSNESKPYSENTVSGLFRIEGLPKNFKKPLRMAIKYEGSLSEESYLAIGEKTAVKSLGDLVTTYSLLPAADSAGFLVCILPITKSIGGSFINLTKRSDIIDWILAVGVTNIIDLMTAEGHFRIHGQKGKTSPNQLTDIGLNCENAYNTFISKGFNYSNRTSWPIPVFLREMDDNWGYYTGSFFLDDHGYLVLNTKLFSKVEELPVTVGHEFLHLVQELYDPRNWDEKVYDFSPRYWMDEATAIYAEEFFVNNPNLYVSSTFTDYFNSPFNGFHLEGNSAGHHGYGMASVIKYLNSRFLSSQIVNLYKDILLEKHPIDALIFNANETTDWVAPFFREYVQGKIYNISPYNWINSVRADQTFILDSKDDTLKNYKLNYPDLSADIFSIKLQYKEWKENTKIYFSIIGAQNPKTEVSVYRHNSSNAFEFLGNDISTVIVPNLNLLSSQGWDLFVLITNSNASQPYTNNTEIDLRIDVKEPEEEIKTYKLAYIDLHIKGYNNRVTVDSSYEDPYYEFYETYAPEQIGSITDSIFTASWNYSRTDDFPQPGTQVTWTGSIQIVFSKNFDKVISYTESNSENWPGWRTQSMGVSVKDIPFYQSGDQWTPDVYRLSSGEETCNSVVSRSFQLVWWDGSSLTFSRNECDNESYIEITLYED